MKAKYSIYDTGELSVQIGTRNAKLGNIPQFNLLPGDTPLRTKKEVLTNISGTCGKYSKFCKKNCYAIKCALYNQTTVIPAWGRNTLLLRNDPQKVREGINEYCRKNIVRYFRFHTSGELENLTHLALYCDICFNRK